MLNMKVISPFHFLAVGPLISYKIFSFSIFADNLICLASLHFMFSYKSVLEEFV